MGIRAETWKSQTTSLLRASFFWPLPATRVHAEHAFLYLREEEQTKSNNTNSSAEHCSSLDSTTWTDAVQAKS